MILSGPDSVSVRRGFSLDFSWNTKQLIKATIWAGVKSLKTPLNNISVTSSSSQLNKENKKKFFYSFNKQDALNTFYLRLYGVRHMVKDHSDSERGNPLPPHRLLFPVVYNWFIKGRGMYCSVYGKVHIKDPLLLIEKSSLCGSRGFSSKKCVNMTIWMTSNNRW